MAPSTLSPSEEKDSQLDVFSQETRAPTGLKRFVGSEENELKRVINSRQLSFIALGGTIGTVSLKTI